MNRRTKPLTLEELKEPAPYVPVHKDPKIEIRRIVKEHRALIRTSVALNHMHSDRTAQRDFGPYKAGDKIPNILPGDAKGNLATLSDWHKKSANRLVAPMREQLRRLPTYSRWLCDVAGVGEITAGYLLSYIDIHKAEKLSSLRRYCGLGINSKGVRDSLGDAKERGECSAYNVELKTAIYQAMSSMFRIGGGYSNTSKTCKYLDVWRNYHYRMQHSERVQGKKLVRADGKEVSAAGFIHETGRRKATDVLLEDLYIVWRSVEGLPVWPSYYAAKLGYAHGGEKINVAAPKLLSVDEALATVGNCSWINAAVAAE